jgi:hypothetical protein
MARPARLNCREILVMWKRGERVPSQQAMKYTADRPFADPEKAARKFLEIANATEAVQDGRIHIERLNGSFPFKHGGSPSEHTVGLALAISRGWLWRHESETYVMFTPGRHRAFRLMMWGTV